MKKYDSYKDSGIEWIGNIPKHWDESKIKYLSKEPNSLFIDGDWIESKVIIEEGIRYITTGNIKVGYYSEQGAGFISEETFAELNCTEVFEGDLVISRLNNPIGRACIIPNLNNRIVTSVDNVIFRPDSNVNKFYLLYLFSSKEYFEITDLISRGATMQRISRGLYGNIKIPLPSIEEQTAIANYLDHKTNQIDTLISKKQQFITLLQEERIAVINQAVTKGLDTNVPMKDSGIEWLGEIPEHWAIEKLKFKSKIISKGTTPSTVGCEIIDKGEIRYIKSENIVENSIQSNPEFYIDSETNQILKRSQLEINDVLIVIAGASIGKVAILTEEFYPSNTNQAVSFIRLNNISSSVYVWYWLQTSFIKERILFDATQSAQPNLSMESIGNFPIPKLSNDDEIKITTFLDKKTGEIDTIISKTNQEIELLKEYKMALISEVVTGKVDVREEILN
jgi:type I restriction enzyme S subunit